MVTIATRVNSATGASFPAADVTQAIVDALTWCSQLAGETVSENTNDSWDLFVTELATKLLMRSRKIIHSRTDKGIDIPDVTELITAEMKNLLILEEPDDTIVFSNDPPTQDYAV